MERMQPYYGLCCVLFYAVISWKHCIVFIALDYYGSGLGLGLAKKVVVCLAPLN
jgi:hypothetical protein